METCQSKSFERLWIEYFLEWRRVSLTDWFPPIKNWFTCLVLFSDTCDNVKAESECFLLGRIFFRSFFSPVFNMWKKNHRIKTLYSDVCFYRYAILPIDNVRMSVSGNTLTKLTVLILKFFKSPNCRKSVIEFDWNSRFPPKHICFFFEKVDGFWRKKRFFSKPLNLTKLLGNAYRMILFPRKSRFRFNYEVFSAGITK